MRDTYTIKLIKTHNPLLFFLNKTLKNVKGNLFPSDLNPENGASKFMLIIFEDEAKLIINLDQYLGYELSKDLFYITAKKAEQESQGQFKAPTPPK